MRFLMMHKMTPEMEAGTPPEPEVMAGIGQLMEEAMKQKVFEGGEGLKPSALRAHVTYQGERRTLTRGPFVDPKELLSGYLLLRVRSEEEALGWCDRWAAAVGDLELYLGPVVEPWDLGMSPEPSGAPLRFLVLLQTSPSADQASWVNDEATQDILEEMGRSGVLQASGSLEGTRSGARILYSGKKSTVVDGPFAESKELIAGYAIFDLPSKTDAIQWATRFGEIVQVNEVEVRVLREER